MTFNISLRDKKYSRQKKFLFIAIHIIKVKTGYNTFVPARKYVKLNSLHNVE